MKDLTGQRFSGQYTLEKRIGSGGMADVYKAWDSARSIYMAIKVLHNEHSDQQKTLAMFENEAQFLKQLGHPNIARLYEFRHYQSYHYLVLEWIDGQSLDRVIKLRKKPLSLGEVSKILSAVSAALHYLHNKQVLHCDIKPGNILLARNQKIYLADLGVARLISAGTTGGTPPYMAPEQFKSGALSPKTDIYSLGITVFELLSGGEVPFRGTNPQSQGSTLQEKIAWEHNNLPLPSIHKLNGGVPDMVCKVVEKALAKDPAQRFNACYDFYNAFEAARLGREFNDPKGTGKRARSDKTTFVNHLPDKGPGNGGRGKPGRMDFQPIDSNLDKDYRGQQRLIGLKGQYLRRVIPIIHKQISFGRSAQMQVQFSDRSVSRSHVLLFKLDNNIYIRDSGSSLGTIVNNQPINGIQKLKHKDIIQIGYNEFFEYRDK